MGPGIEEIKRDLSPLFNLSSGTWEEPGDTEEDKPLTWVMLTGKPITRFVAGDRMQNEMQSSLLLGSLFVLITMSIGFRSIKQAIVSLDTDFARGCLAVRPDLRLRIFSEYCHRYDSHDIFRCGNRLLYSRH